MCTAQNSKNCHRFHVHSVQDLWKTLILLSELYLAEWTFGRNSGENIGKCGASVSNVFAFSDVL